MKDLPPFIAYPTEKAQALARRAFNHGQKPEESCFIRLIPHADHHFRVIFRLEYFALADGQTLPSKSQWNTLKKRIKRMNPQIFIFKDHGVTAEGGYLDVGFLSPP